MVAVNSQADSTMQMSFPASAVFSTVANVAASNIAYRLNYKMTTVRRLQRAVDAASEALTTSGNIKLEAEWSSGPLSLTLSNPRAKLTKGDVQELQDILTELGATRTAVKATSVAFTITG